MNNVLEEKYKVSKLIFFVISVFLNSFIILHACLNGEISSKWSSSLSQIIEKVLNSGKGKTPPQVLVESLSLSYLDSYQYNKVDGYEDYQIPVGCTKLLASAILPNNATDPSISWTVSDDSIVSLNKQGNNLAITGIKSGNTSITATSNNNNNAKDTLDFEVVDLAGPTDFSIPIENMSIPLNGGDIVPINIINNDLINKTYDQDVFLPRYYDIRKLTYSSSNPSIIEIGNIDGLDNILLAKSIGTSTITVSNDRGISHEITVSVVAEQSPQILPDNDEIVCYADDLDLARTDNSIGYQLGIDNVLYVPSNPYLVRVSGDGRVIGYRKTSKDDIYTSIKAIDKNDLTNIKEYTIRLTSHPLEGISLSISGASLSDDIYSLEMGHKMSVNIIYKPSNVYDASFTIISSNENVATIIPQGSSFYVDCLNEGDVVITITCNENDSITKNIRVKVRKRGIINSDNRNEFFKFIRKSWGHFLLFMLSGLFTTLALYQFSNKYIDKWWISILISISVGIAIAGLSELIQSFVPGRSGNIQDVVVDFVGYILPVLIVTIILFVHKRCGYKGNNN